MSINDYWVAKMNATEASGEATSEIEVPVDEVEILALDEEIPVDPDDDEFSVDEEALLAPDEDEEVAEDLEEEPVEESSYEVPTSEQTKAQISEWLTNTHGVDPDDLKGLNKAELLDLVDGLVAGE